MHFNLDNGIVINNESIKLNRIPLSLVPHEKGTINAPIGRSKENRKMQAIREDGKPAVTHFTVLERFEGFTLVEFYL